MAFSRSEPCLGRWGHSNCSVSMGEQSLIQAYNLGYKYSINNGETGRGII